jgi:hypothetical protein
MKDTLHNLRLLNVSKTPTTTLFNYEKNPTQFAALMGMARGLSADGE